MARLCSTSNRTSRSTTRYRRPRSRSGRVAERRARRAASGSRTSPGDTGRQGRARSPVLRPANSERLHAVYRALLEAHGAQQWWPYADEDGRFEICLGAILTQNTAWRSAARALENLRAAGAWAAAAILALPQDAIADLVRPSGHFNVKARK